MTSEGWELDEAGAKFRELVDLAVSTGPQVIIKGGQDLAVVASSGDWRRLTQNQPSDLSPVGVFQAGAEPRFQSLKTFVCG